MAQAHQFDINSVQKFPQSDVVVVSGAVDGQPVTIQVWLSALNGMTLAQQKGFVAARMLAAVQSEQGQDLPTLTGSFSQ
jgi:hypothetical protein